MLFSKSEQCCFTDAVKLTVQIRKVLEEKKNQFVFLEGYLFNVCSDIFCDELFLAYFIFLVGMTVRSFESGLVNKWRS